ncbi:SH3 domain-containing protein [Stagnimonas aquatica]|uniref:SH3 domain-containing protein n=1 Tax=Stagnimonas aquatica TaxID=2689987 RepID=A0A3N0VHC6_9GAMM|nr:SH3 domain-containing protein [Stagnimonas aquatica]ROH92153.1 SH3 domain-containing protein [Stagnimonas aquatica]
MNQAIVPARLLLIALAGVALAACASGPLHKAPAGNGGSIHTAAIGQAPPAEPPSFGSKPLSELNTPDAIAAREAQGRLGGGVATPPPAFPAYPDYPAEPPPPPLEFGTPPPVLAYPAPSPSSAPPRVPVASMAPGEPAAAHAQVSAFSKGAKVSARPGAALRLRPNSASEAIQSLLLDTPVVLDSRVYNAEGYWWYVTSGADDGWVAQSDLLIP